MSAIKILKVTKIGLWVGCQDISNFLNMGMYVILNKQKVETVIIAVKAAIMECHTFDHDKYRYIMIIIGNMVSLVIEDIDCQ